MLNSLSRNLVLLVVFLLAPGPILPVSAQDRLLPVFHFNHLSNEDGLFSGYVTSRVVRDSLGFVWIGTVDGLERYDGYRIRDYRNRPDDPYSLSSNTITSLLVDTHQRLWVGTWVTGLSLYDRVHDRFVNFPPRAGDSSWYNAGSIYGILEDRSGTLWLATPDGVVRVDLPLSDRPDDVDNLAQGTRFRTYPLGTPPIAVHDLSLREDGKIVVASDKGLLILDPQTSMISRPALAGPLGQRLDSLFVYRLAKDNRGNLWIGTGVDGLFHIDWRSGSIENYRHRAGDPLSIGRNDILDIVVDRQGDVWMATPLGLELFSPVDGHRVPFLAYDGAPPGATGTTLSVDGTGTLWIGTQMEGGGIHWLSRKSFRFPHYSIPDPDGRPVGFETIERDRDGTFWMSSSGMLFKVDVADLRILKSIDVFGGKQQTDRLLDRRSSFLDDSGRYWYGTWGLGLYGVDLGTGRVLHHSYESRRRKECIVASIAEGTGDTLWTAAWRDGVMQFDRASGKFRDRPDIPTSIAESILKDHAGNIWVAANRAGLYVHDPGAGTTRRFVHDPARAHSLSKGNPEIVYEDPSERVWIGVDEVINRWDPSRQSFIRYPNTGRDRVGLAMPISTDRSGRLWVSYDEIAGLSILEPSSGEYTDFDVSDGVCGLVVDMESLDSGRVLLAGRGGLNIFHPDSIELRRSPPVLVITRMTVHDEAVNPPALRSTDGPLRLSHEQDVLEFEFAAIDVDAPDLVQYQYQLEGQDRDWVTAKDRRFVRYPGLPPGEYTFRVRAASARGEWPDQVIALAVSIGPPWWRTGWFTAVATMTLLGLCAFIYRREVTRLRMDRLMQQEFSRKQIESQEAERMRLAAELHDGLGQDLLVVSNELQRFAHEGSGSKEALERAARLLQETIQTVREISSNLHPHQLDRLGFCAAVEAVTDGLGRSTGISVHRSCDNIDRLLPKETEIHMYRIIQEALANVARHASARNVTIHVKKHLGSIEFSVEDDGRGFDTKAPQEHDASRDPGRKNHGFGLSSMRERVRIIGGTLAVDSTPGTGTRVHVSLPYS